MTELSNMKLKELTDAYNEMALTAIDLGIKAKTIKLFKDRPTGLKRCQQLDAEIRKLSGKGSSSAPPKRKTAINEEGKITVLAQENPKRGKAKDIFAFYKNGMLVSTFIEKVNDRALALATLRWDVKKGFISIA